MASGEGPCNPTPGTVSPEPLPESPVVVAAASAPPPQMPAAGPNSAQHVSPGGGGGGHIHWSQHGVCNIGSREYEASLARSFLSSSLPSCT
jgi:hypothetical protein